MREIEIEELRRATKDYCDIVRDLPAREAEFVAASLRLHSAKEGALLSRGHVRASNAVIAAAAEE